LSEFFKVLELKEEKYMNEKILTKGTYTTDLLLEDCTLPSGVINIDMYRTRYTQKHFESETSCVDACIKYLEGLQWVLGYYLDGVKSWTWYYPYHYSPQVSFLKNTISTFIFSNIGKHTKAVTPFEQLLCVLPPESSHLIPEPLRPIMLDQTSPLRQYIPDVIEIDKSGKHADWEGVVLIPMVDFALIESVYTSALQHLTPLDLERNTPQDSKTYVFNPTARNFVDVRRIEI
jgi:5'-3' exoribonuclease 1